MQLLPREHGFDQPLGLLKDCHLRVERFLRVLKIVVQEAPDNWLPTQYEEGLRSALDYFRDAAPKHTQDEEESLFPRICQNPEALRIIRRLESEHAFSEPYHQEIEELGRRWLSQGCINGSRRCRFMECVTELIALYQEHIRIEEEELFPLAAAILDEQAIKAIGQEMATRRDLLGGNEL